MGRSRLMIFLLSVALQFAAFHGLVLRGQEAQKSNPSKEDVRFFGEQIQEKAPNFDDIYLDKAPGDRVPDPYTWYRDEDRPKAKDLVGHNLPPILLEVVCHNPIVKPGETVHFTMLLDDPTVLPPHSLSFDGPNGRRGDQFWWSARFINATNRPGIQVFKGELSVSRWAQGGYYKPNYVLATNELGLAKAYMSDHHVAMKNAWFKVEDNPNADIEHPRVTHFSLFDSKQTPQGKGISIKEFIPVYLKAEDDKSSIRTVEVQMLGPAGPNKKSIIFQMLPSADEPGLFKALIGLNRYYSGGEYFINSVRISDGAGNQTYLFGATDPLIRTARFTVKENDSADTSPPALFDISADKHIARAGDEVKVRAIVADDLSGVEHVTIHFMSPHWLHKVRLQLRRPSGPPIMIKSGLDVEDNIFEGTIKLSPLVEPGDWRLTRVVASDRANNYLNLQYEEHQSFKDFKITFTSDRKPGPVIGELLSSTGGSLPNSAVAPTGAAAVPASTPGASQQSPRIRRVDMIPPHPPRGACLNCHEP